MLYTEIKRAVFDGGRVIYTMGVDDERGLDCGSSASRLSVVSGRLDGVGEIDGWGGRRRRDEPVGW